MNPFTAVRTNLAAARFNRREAAGSLGDLGTFLPLLVAMSAKNGLDFAAGLFFAGLGFLIMVAAANIVIAGGGNVRVSPWWLVGSYFLQTLGELALSPVGLSSMTKLAPRKFVGQMMGVWFMAAALGNLIAGIVGGHVDPENLEQMPQLFRQTAMSLFIATLVLGALIIPIRNMMRESSMKQH